ncbi:MAG: class I SAM-dependent methyltransferase [Bacilli bacterium]
MENIWDKIHFLYKDKKVVYDDWLLNYNEIIETARNGIILDLGCGMGNNTLYLKDKNIKCISADYSVVALQTVKKTINTNTLEMDIRKKFPFKENSLDLIIADLSLHYFSKTETLEILKEIKRVLKKDSYLLFRVNSIEDVNHGAIGGEFIEENYYLTEGYNKRFFNEKDLEFFFKDFNNKEFIKDTMSRYTSKKVLYRGKCQK